MANQSDEIVPVSSEKIRQMTAAGPANPVEARKGPLVYDLTFTPSLNGIEPSGSNDSVDSDFNNSESDFID